MKATTSVPYQDTPPPTRLAAAIAYAAAGIPVFPCEPGGKRPLTPRGHLDATTDPDQIRRWWHKHPNANIGIPTGQRSGLLVLDVDNAGSFEAWEAEHGELTPTATVKTGSGGMHLYYRHPAGEPIRNSAGKLGPGLDIRGAGGYVVAPGSRTTGSYEWRERSSIADAPDSLIEALRAPRSAADGELRPASRIEPAAILDGETIPQGQRNYEMFRIAASLRGRGLDAGAILAELEQINAARCSPPLDAGELAKIIGSVAKYAPGTGSPGPNAATREVLRAVERAIWASAWRGTGGKSERDVLIALLKLAREHSTLIPGGVRVSISIRALALAAAISKRATENAVRRLRYKGLIRRDGTGEKGKSGAFVLSDPRAKVGHSTTVGWSETSVLPLRAPRLRWSAPETLRLGKTCGAVIDHLEAAGGELEIGELAEALHVLRVRDFRNRNLKRLEAAGVVECFGDTVTLARDWLDALDRERELRGEIAAYRRDMARFDRERTAYRTLHERPADPLPEPEPIRDVSHLSEEPEPAAVVECSPLEPDNPASPSPDPELLIALNRYLFLNPSRRNESPSWLSITLWAEGRTPDKVPPAEIAAALLLCEWAA